MKRETKKKEKPVVTLDYARIENSSLLCVSKRYIDSISKDD